MNKDATFMTVIVGFCSFLLLSSAYLIEFQKWLAFNQGSGLSSSQAAPALSQGLRSLVNHSEIDESSHSPIEHTWDLDALTPSVNISSVSKVPELITNQPEISNESALSNLSLNQQKTNPVAFNFKTTLSDQNELQTSPFIAELDEELLVEFPAGYSKQQKKHALARLLTLADINDIDNLLSKKAINTKQKPYFYRRVLNQFKSPIRYPAQGYRYADYLLVHHIEEISEPEGNYQLVRIPLHKPVMPAFIEPYHAWVKQYSKEFGIPSELVYAVMQTESFFNPKAVSKSNALGLMQIKQKAAGRDVYKYIDNRHDFPSRQALFNPQENIRIGVAYMGLLKDKYLKQVKNPESKELLMIASYNGGLSKALKVFGNSPQQALRRINQLYPRNVYHKLRYSHSSDETRRYVEKVLKNKEKFSEIIQKQV